MISISRLLCGTHSPGDSLRYGESSSDAIRVSNTSPVVVWNCTSQCNLHCAHCYASANEAESPTAMDTASAKAFIGDLAGFGVPVILFSGGEPLLRSDLFELSQLAVERGIRVALSSNGTLITSDVARKLSGVGFAEIGISLDGMESTNDSFRGKLGSYGAAVEGIRNCINHGLRVSLRFTITRFNYREVPAIFRLAEDEGVSRLCFYHLAYSGRGSNLIEEDINHSQTRQVVDTICEHTMDLYRRGLPKEVLTVANHADGVHLYLKLKEKNPQRAYDVLELLRRNGGNNSGMRIGAVDHAGNVHPDQFWWHYSPGNVLKRKFGDIWTDTSDPVMGGLKKRKKLLKGRCARCGYLDICNGNLRVRAQAVYGDIWADDPACYLTDEEIGIG
ncbi:MAG: radical SAM protein [Chloroflexi bacterium]|nr:radical SAM protein [Chloroflexota bacterium]